MNVDVCTCLPITTAMNRLDLRIEVSLPGNMLAADAGANLRELMERPKTKRSGTQRARRRRTAS
jgi:hypothetical protein